MQDKFNYLFHCNAKLHTIDYALFSMSFGDVLDKTLKINMDNYILRVLL